jgi:hypothetical protein
VTSRLLAVGASAAAVLASPGLALARDVDAPTLRRLATRAVTDPAALQRLRTVSSVDGRPVDLAAALRGARGAALHRRLAALTATAPRRPTGDPRGAARDILAQRRFHQHALPRPLKRPLDWLAERLRPVDRALSDAFRAVAGLLPGGDATLWVGLGAIVLALAAWVSSGLARRRAGAIEADRARAAAVGGRDPRALEREAEHAERAGDFERAVRLRFRAGLLRLDAADILAFDPALTSGELARRLRSPAFDALALRFDEIAYGRRASSAVDARTAREAWRAVLAEAAPG